MNSNKRLAKGYPESSSIIFLAISKRFLMVKRFVVTVSKKALKMLLNYTTDL